MSHRDKYIELVRNLFFWVALCTIGSSLMAEEATKPNILFIAIDDLRPKRGQPAH